MLNKDRPTWAEIDLDNLIHNYKTILNLIGDKKIIPVVKANAYGHGSIEVVRQLYKTGVDYFAVSLMEEALEIRKYFTDISLLVMGAISPNSFEMASKNNITVSVYSQEIGTMVLNSKLPLKCHIKFDSGMNRLGLKDENEMIELVDKFNTQKRHDLEGIYTHFATSDDNKEFFDLQLNRFKSMLNKIKKLPKIIHVSNSSSILKYEKDIPFTTHTRLGISLYGLSLEKNISFLKPLMSIKTEIVQVKKLNPGDFVGYGITYQAKQVETIGIIPIGYADGLIRKNNTGFVAIKNKKYPFVGRICMDYAFVKIDDTVTVGQEVIIMGSKLVTIDEVASRLDTISYEVVCQISDRIPRIYIRKDV